MLLARNHLNPASVMMKTTPPEHLQAKRYGRRVKCIDIAVIEELLNAAYAQIACFLYHNICNLFEYLRVTSLIGFGQIAPCYGLPKPKPVEL